MFNLRYYLQIGLFLLLPLFFINCGGGGSTPQTEAQNNNNAVTLGGDDNDEFSQSDYKGLSFYYKDMPQSDYKLEQLDNASFNALTPQAQLQVADKLLTTLFFGYPLQELQEMIDAGSFIDTIRSGLTEDTTDKAWLENYIIDSDYFDQKGYNEQVAVDILTRFYAMKDLDSYFLKNWVAYILTQTIMFSPAYELESTHTPNIARVYNRIVTMLDVDSGMRYISYVHMMSEDNWRRFRSPEDNGREMLEIFALDMDDSHVPIAGQALKNWKLDRESDTLVVSLNENREPLQLFNTTIYNGDDFYRELAKSDLFTNGVTSRLVHFFFPDASDSKRADIINKIVSSNPETWQDILLQIVFSKTYLLDNTRAKSAEELFFSMAKKMDFKHRVNTLHEFKDALEEMHQASMKYKLGKTERVPLDTLSFAAYHKYFRERFLLRQSSPESLNEYDAWNRQGWDQTFVANENFNFDGEDVTNSLESFIHYMFNATIARSASAEELALFKEHMIITEEGFSILDNTFNMFRTDDNPTIQYERREDRKRNIAILVLDYISRLAETYTLKEVK